jgi:hypothetical protein
MTVAEVVMSQTTLDGVGPTSMELAIVAAILVGLMIFATRTRLGRKMFTEMPLVSR